MLSFGPQAAAHAKVPQVPPASGAKKRIDDVGPPASPAPAAARTVPSPRRPPFASLLRELRHSAGLTQEELATRAGIGVRTVRDLEAGRATRPQRSTIDLLADALDLPDAARTRFLAASRGRSVPQVSLPRVELLIGRAEDVSAVTALTEVADLVTIVGLAGVGKTALALTVAHHLVSRFPGGVGAVTLARAQTESDVLVSAAASLGVSHVEELAQRSAAEPALLIVAGADENPAAATAAITWLRERARVRVVATSRHPLGLSREHEWTLGPLDVPPPSVSGAEVLDYPATKLFLDRLRRVRQTPIVAGDLATIGALVRHLGGLPLALELAAARGRVLDLEAMLTRAAAPSPLREDTATTGGQTRPVDPAGDAVRASVLASWALLTEGERLSLCWLSVFAEPWSLELAEELLAGHATGSHAGTGSQGGLDAIAVVDRLVGLGLVRARVHGSHKFFVFDVVRRIALAQAARHGLLEAARERHAMVIARDRGIDG